ncbi:hypothetical protein Vi05172_g12876 [Venturia inaequalis]|nr:hypothetical protein Vi05172_g12876 [Venturia inaequalis]
MSAPTHPSSPPSPTKDRLCNLSPPSLENRSFLKIPHFVALSDSLILRHINFQPNPKTQLPETPPASTAPAPAPIPLVEQAKESASAPPAQKPCDRLNPLVLAAHPQPALPNLLYLPETLLFSCLPLRYPSNTPTYLPFISSTYPSIPTQFP